MAVKVNYQNVGRSHLDVRQMWRQGKSRLTRIYLLPEFVYDISKGCRVMVISVFSKWRLAAIFDFHSVSC